MPEPRGPERVTLYPHGGEREWSSKMWDEWKREMGEEYVRADLVPGVVYVVVVRDDEGPVVTSVCTTHELARKVADELAGVVVAHRLDYVSGAAPALDDL